MATEILEQLYHRGIINKVDKLPYTIDPKPKGRGRFGVVYKGEDSFGKAVAVKKIRVDRLRDSEIEDFFWELLAEIKAIRKLSLECPNHVIRYVDALWDNDVIYIVTDWHPGMTGNDWAMSSPHPEAELEKVVSSMILGLACIHQADIVHRDIKPSNMMVDPVTLHVKFIDLGLACLRNVCKETTGTMPFRLAPEYTEVMKDASASLEDEKKMDMWALGISIYSMLHPPESKLPVMMPSINALLLKNKEQYPASIFRVLQNLLQSDPASRSLTVAQKYLTHTPK